VEVQLHAFLSSALDSGEWSRLIPGRFTPGKEPPVPTVREAEWAPEPNGRGSPCRPARSHPDSPYAPETSDKYKGDVL